MSATHFPPSLVAALRGANRVAVLTGAGISAESGVPTFRDALTGLWSRFRPEELATPEAYRRNPKMVWDWYAWRRRLVLDAQPNAGHLALVSMEGRVAAFTLITQNVDGLHTRAGSRRVIELHGNIHRNRCFDDGPAELDRGECSPGAEAPRCDACGGLTRPAVVWFGEGLPEEEFALAEQAAAESDVFLSIGTAAAVFPAADLPEQALRGGATLVEINREATPLSEVAHYSLRGLAGEILPSLVRAAWP